MRGRVGDHGVDHLLHVDALGLGDLGDRRVAVLELGAEVVRAQVQRLGGGVEVRPVPAGTLVVAGLGAGHGGHDEALTEHTAAGESRNHGGGGDHARGPELGAHENPFCRGLIARQSRGRA